jgi:enamine deaminase RidA (YjgF/YER057c/UK114 family)
MSRTVVNSPLYKVPIAVDAGRPPFSQSVRVDAGASLLFVSGLTSRDADGEFVHAGDLENQVRQVMTNLSNVLQAAGASLADVVKITTFVLDPDAIPRISRIRLEYLGEPGPASSTVAVARLVDPRMLIELEAVAVLPS